MFTLEQIQKAHSQVKSGADFPAYIQKLKELGVLSYTAYVNDGHIDYVGASNTALCSSPKYPPLPIAPSVNDIEFKSELKAHQQGQTDYPTFITMCAKTGIHHWVIDFAKMACVYFNALGQEILSENIPQISQ